jgi:hypothetical protein
MFMSRGITIVGITGIITGIGTAGTAVCIMRFAKVMNAGNGSGRSGSGMRSATATGITVIGITGR